MKTINRRSFFGKAAVMIGVLSAAPMTALLAGPQKVSVQEVMPLIEINGADLQLHLESFMYEVLAEIQVRASEEGAEFLLGVK